VPDKSQLE